MPSPIKRIATKLCIATGITLLLGSGTASAMSFTFSRIASTESGFSSLGVPSFVASTIFFRANPDGGSTGIFAASGGGSTTIATTGGSGFGSVGNPSGGRGVFTTTNSSGQPGIYTPVGGTLAAVIPNGRRFTTISAADDNNDTVVFRATDPSGEGIYRSTTPDTSVADQNTALPGQGPATNGGQPDTFDSFGDPVSDGDVVIFEADSDQGQDGIYAADGDTVETVVDDGTTTPEGDSFDEFGNPVADAGQLAFAASNDNGGSGIYTSNVDGSGLQTVADTNTSLPGDGSEQFTSFSDPSLDNGLVAFAATGSGGSGGIYTGLNGIVEQVINLNTELDGKTLSSLVLGQDAVDNGSLTFLAGFNDDSSAIYLATPLGPIVTPQAPTPATLALFLLGIAALGSKQRQGNRHAKRG